MFEMAGEGGLQAVVMVPDSVVRRLRYGQSATVRVPSVESADLAGTVSEIAAEAGDASAFRVAIGLDRTPSDLRPGMAANATFAVGGATDDQPTYLIPISALALREMAVSDRKRTEGHVFVFDPASSTVKRRQVRGSSSVGNRLVITDGLSPGDQVVIAGVAFLREGMRVELWEPPS
jgi:RND family efflux transporter MFP subunit